MDDPGPVRKVHAGVRVKKWIHPISGLLDMNPDHSEITVSSMEFFDKCLYYDILKVREYTYNFSLKM